VKNRIIRLVIRVTVRQLEAIVRLSEALAKLHYETTVNPKHVKTSIKLLLNSIQSVKYDDLCMEKQELTFLIEAKIIVTLF